MSKKSIRKDYKIFNQDSKVTILNGDIIDFENDIVKQMCDKFYDDKIVSIIIEGGTKTLSNFLNSNTWDEMRIFKTQEKLGDGIKSPVIKSKAIKNIKIGNNELEYHLNNGVAFSNI